MCGEDLLFSPTVHVCLLFITRRSTPYFSCMWDAKHPIDFVLLLSLPPKLVSFSDYIYPLIGAEGYLPFLLIPPGFSRRLSDVCCMKHYREPTGIKNTHPSSA